MRAVGFELKEGARFQAGAKPDATIIGNHLEMLRKHFKGELTPQDVVDDARKNNSPLHSMFEWKDGVAAEQYRLSQARGLIRSVVAVYRDDEPETPVRRMQAFVHIPEKETPHYRSMGHAMSQKATRDLVLRRAWDELKAWRRRYKDLQELAEIFSAMDEVQIEDKRKAS